MSKSCNTRAMLTQPFSACQINSGTPVPVDRTGARSRSDLVGQGEAGASLITFSINIPHGLQRHFEGQTSPCPVFTGFGQYRSHHELVEHLRRISANSSPVSSTWKGPDRPGRSPTRPSRGVCLRALVTAGENPPGQFGVGVHLEPVDLQAQLHAHLTPSAVGLIRQSDWLQRLPAKDQFLLFHPGHIQNIQDEHHELSRPFRVLARIWRKDRRDARPCSSRAAGFVPDKDSSDRAPPFAWKLLFELLYPDQLRFRLSVAGLLHLVVQRLPRRMGEAWRAFPSG